MRSSSAAGTQTRHRNLPETLLWIQLEGKWWYSLSVDFGWTWTVLGPEQTPELFVGIYIYRGVQTLALAEMAHHDGAAFSFSLWITNTFILFSRASYLSGDWLWWSCRWRLSLCFIELVHHLFSETLDFFFLSLRVYYSFRLICILIWELFAFLLLDTEQIVTQEAYESWLTPITLPPNKNNHFPSNYETEQLAACSLGPGGRQHHYLHRFDYAAAGRVTLSALESNVCWLCIMSKSEAERLLFKSHVTH